MKAQTEQPPAAGSHGRYEPCEECGAPLDPQQRYCVHCAARRGNGANPASRYFAAMSKRARRPVARPPAKASGGSRAAAVGFFALLPIAVAIGVVVGKAGSGEDNGALVQALREQNAAVAGSGAAQAGTVAATGPKSKNGGKQAKAQAKGGGKVVAHTANGTVHQVTGFKATKKQIEEDTKIIEDNPEQTGSNYIKAQQSLPDVVVVGGNPGSAPAAPTGGGEP